MHRKGKIVDKYILGVEGRSVNQEPEAFGPARMI